MDDAQAKGRTVAPICPFLSAWRRSRGVWVA
ncbi:hypothetical protein EV384_3626 [Micromonospora kangleipakensis]|uniref:Uncharacterized protein n=1 Tax=Micromonospora kangleipakensis TaxID=1077942 RepID=A0A4Q8BBB5_9ACTN|nr:hypothetical protein EV384_3626 [Micromonospora kangleipakensis]